MLFPNSSLAWVALGSTPSPTSVPSGEFFERFLISSGFAGLMTLAAAVIAGVFAFAQYRNNKRQQRQDRWWDTLNWVIDRTILQKDEEPVLPPTVMISVLWALHQTSSKTDHLQFLTVRALHDLFQLTGEAAASAIEQKSVASTMPFRRRQRTNSNEKAQSYFQLLDPEAVALLIGLRHKLELREHNSLMTSVVTYEPDVVATLTRITKGSQFRVRRGLETDRPILLVCTDVCWVILVAHKQGQLSPEKLKSAGQQSRRSYQDKSDNRGRGVESAIVLGIIVITADVSSGRLDKHAFTHWRWRGPHDNDKLRTLIVDLAIRHQGRGDDG
jgi:hypothetical protein